MYLTAAVCVALCASALTACSYRASSAPPPGRDAPVAAAPAAPATAPAPASADPNAWRDQALRLARAVRDAEGSLSSPPEPSAATRPAGTFAARVLDVRPDGTLVLDRQQLFVGDAASAAARTAGGAAEMGIFALDVRPERLAVAPASDAAFVVWYPEEAALDVSPKGVAAMSALDAEQFARLYREDGAKRASLAAWGGWVTVVDGKVTSFLEVNSP